ncbi:MAG TPA: type II secretion system F family protein [Bryobacteraceae bacterium]|nr:type II secretion system F family protein [Bryobacteraceae bacterium]
MLIALIVFVAAFVAAALILFALASGASDRNRQALATLEGVVAGGRAVQEEIVNLRKNEMASAIPWLDRLLARVDLAPRLARLLAQADLKWTAGGLLLAMTGCSLPAFYLVQLRTHMALAAMAVALAAGAAPLLYVLRARAKRFDKFQAGLPEALDVMTNALRGGHSLISALSVVARESGDPIGKEFRICFEEQNYGLELRTALENLVGRVPLQDLRIISTAILVQKESGGNLAEVLDKAAQVIRERFTLLRQIRVHTAQGRMTGWSLTLLPPVLGVLMFLLNPGQMSLLWTTATGRKAMAIGFAMNVTGGLLIRKIVRIRV